jgi:hypothetical protein
MIAHIGEQRGSDCYRDTATASILKEAELWLWDLAEIDADTEADPDSWEFPQQTRDYIIAAIEDADDELARRERLRSRPGAPAWPRRWPDRREELATIKAAIDLPHFVEQACKTPLARRGRNLVGRCPLPGHEGDNDPSLTIYPDGRGWYCFGCHRGGDVFSLAMHMLGTDRFGDVVDALAIEAGIERPGKERANVG